MAIARFHFYADNTYYYIVTKSVTRQAADFVLC